VANIAWVKFSVSFRIALRGDRGFFIVGFVVLNIVVCSQITFVGSVIDGCIRGNFFLFVTRNQEKDKCDVDCDNVDFCKVYSCKVYSCRVRNSHSDGFIFE
jgi:hypothetical protein